MESYIIPESVIVSTLIIIIVGCLVGNLTVMILVIARPVLHSATNYFILSLSVADFLVGVIVVSLTLAHILERKDMETPSNLACALPPFIELTCVTASVYSLLCISYDRYRTIVLAKRATYWKTLILAFVGVWVWSFFYASKVFIQDYLSSVSKEEEEEREILVESNSTSGIYEHIDDLFCSILVEEDDADLPYRIADLVVLFIIPVAFMVYIFIRIRRRLWGINVSVTTNVQKKRSVIRFLAFDIVVFVVCWLPFYCIDIVTDSLEEMYDKKGIESKTYVILRFSFILLALSNSLLNPLIYAFFNKNFTSEFRVIVGKVLGFFWRPTRKVSPVEPTATTNRDVPPLQPREESHHGARNYAVFNA